ncbi:hypothetical protein [Ruegeria sp. SCP11]|uniref:hypothetical protein n=1 Tax=Ruegeria sp. SCP11 TaxID=3141378 RepID=UPI00333A6BDC
MQLALFGSTLPHTPLSKVALQAVLRELRQLVVLDPFNLWLVGSAVDNSEAAADIDILLSPRRLDALPTPSQIDDALRAARAYGLQARDKPISIDPTYREAGPTKGICPLHADTVIDSVQLASPGRVQQALKGKLPGYRLVGRYCIGFPRRAKDTNYYNKLPVRQFGSVSLPYLRPAILVADDHGEAQ